MLPVVDAGACGWETMLGSLIVFYGCCPTDQWPWLIHWSYFDCFETGSHCVTLIVPELANPPVAASQILKL